MKVTKYIPLTRGGRAASRSRRRCRVVRRIHRRQDRPLRSGKRVIYLVSTAASTLGPLTCWASHLMISCGIRPKHRDVIGRLDPSRQVTEFPMPDVDNGMRYSFLRRPATSVYWARCRNHRIGDSIRRPASAMRTRGELWRSRSSAFSGSPLPRPGMSDKTPVQEKTAPPDEPHSGEDATRQPLCRAGWRPIRFKHRLCSSRRVVEVVDGNLEAALSEEPRPGADRKLSGKEEALLVATACSEPPRGPRPLDPGALGG